MSSTYSAYVSYNHEDVKFAAWLQRALETYRPPKALAAKLGATPLKPVFRDRADLRSASNLGEALCEALDQSSALIVVCSRTAAASHWVDEEIRRYREVHGSKRIFPIIVADDPPHCFPEALLKNDLGEILEPMAADARRKFDGRRDALLKLIAALLNVEFDELKRRDLVRKQRRMTALAASTTMVATAMLALAMIAYDARNQANRRSAQAEDLIGFMLGDLRQRLEPIGRLDVLDAVGDKATEYFSTLTTPDLTNESRLGRARSLRQIGEVRMAQGDLAAASEAFAASNRQAVALNAEDPQNLEALFELSQGHFWIGYVHYSRNEVDEARSQFEQYLGTSKRLVELAPDNPDYQTEVAYAHSNLGSLENVENNFTAAEEHFGKTAEYNYQRLAEDPENIALKLDLAETISWLGTVAANSLSVDEAIKRFETELKLRNEINEAEINKRSEEKVADASLLLAYQLLLAGRFEEAHEKILDSLRISNGLVVYDPSNANWKRQQAFANMELSRVEAAQGEVDIALARIEPAVEAFRLIADDDVDHVDRRVDLVMALDQYARLLRMAGNNATAISVINEAFGRMSGEEIGSDAAWRSSTARLYLLNGDLLAGAGSAQSWEQGLLMLDGIPVTTRAPVILLTRAELLERMGKLDEARSLRDEAVRIGYRDTAERALSATLVDGDTGR